MIPEHHEQSRGAQLVPEVCADPDAITRKLPEPPHDRLDKRDDFEHDRARIIHSVHFRRLQGKTQIFFPRWADFVRTRVTHVIETSQIGRALAINHGLPPSLVEAACLAHDLGHPPFGHTGEDALNKLMEKHGGFEGNAQTFRILTQIERRAREYRGLNLTRATLLATIKYPYRRATSHKKFLYEDDANEYETWLYGPYDLNLIRKEHLEGQPPRTLACQLMDWADDIAYSVHDLEDGLVSGFLQPASLLEDYVVKRVHDNISAAPVKTRPAVERTKEILAELKGRLRPWGSSPPRSIIREATRHYINLFVTSVGIRRTGEGLSPFHFEVSIPDPVREICAVLKGLVFEFIIHDQRTQSFTSKGTKIVTDLFRTLAENALPAARRRRFLLFPRSMFDLLEDACNSESALARLAADYVASMTEGQAIGLYQRLFEASGGSPFEPV